jgi:hypothetical protein
MTATDPFERAVERDAERRRDRRARAARAGLRIHTAVFLAVNMAIIAIWAVVQAFGEDAGGHPWFLYPLIGWGAGLLAHALLVPRRRDRGGAPA